MAYTSPTSQSAGTPIPTTRLNGYKDGIDYWAGHTTVSSGRRTLLVASQTAVQSIPNTAWTALTLNAEAADYDAGHTTTSKFTVSQAGVLWLMGAYGFASSSVGQRSVGIRVNGTGTSQPTHLRVDIPAPVTSGVVQCSGLIPVNVADYVEVVAFQDSGAALLTGVATADVSCQLHLMLVSL
jgi:hypothetical protein